MCNYQISTQNPNRKNPEIFVVTHSCAASHDCTEALDVNADLSVLDALSSMYQ